MRIALFVKLGHVEYLTMVSEPKLDKLKTCENGIMQKTENEGWVEAQNA